MAEGKKSFLFYTNWGETFDELSDDDAGKLIKHICDYVRDKNPQTDSILIKAVFANIKSILKMDLDKWEAKSLKNSENAKIRWDKKDANVCERIKPNANHADIVNDIDSDNVNDIDKGRDITILNAFKENVLIEAKELNIDQSIYIPFLEHWTERDFESKCYAWQVPETFIIKSRLKGWKRNSDKDEPKKEKNLWT